MIVINKEKIQSENYFLGTDRGTGGRDGGGGGEALYHLLSEILLIFCYQSLCGSMNHFFFGNISFSKHLVSTDEVFVKGIESRGSF